MDDPIIAGPTVSAADISRNFGEWQSRALMAPVTITYHGQSRLVLASVEAFRARAAQGEPGDGDEAQRLKAQHHAILNQMREQFFAFDRDLRVVDASASAELYIGARRDELIGRDLRDFAAGCRDSGGWALLQRVARTNEPVEFRIKSFIRLGSSLEVHAFPFGEGWVGMIFSSVSALEEAQRCQETLDAVLRSLALDQAIAVIRLNLRGGIEMADASFCAMSGFTEAQLQTLMLTDILRPDHRRSLTRTINSLIVGQTAQTTNVIVVTRSGAELGVRLNMSGVGDFSLHGAIIACVVCLDPIGARWEANRKASP